MDRAIMSASLTGTISIQQSESPCARTKLSELAIGNDESSEGPQALKSLVAVLFGGVLIHGSVWHLSITASHLLSLPDEFLQ